MDLTPEQCYTRAMKLMERGKTDKAIKLLQIATLRAPTEGRYREALQTARSLAEQSAAAPAEAPQAPGGGGLAEATAEDLYQEAMALKGQGDTERARRILQLAVAKAPGEAKYREAMAELRRPAPRPAEEPKKDASAAAMEKIIREEESAEPTLAPRPRAAPAVGRSQAAMGAVLAVLVLVLGGIWYSRQPAAIDTAPYTSQLPVVSAASAVQGELSLGIDEAQWRALSREEQASRLRGTMAEASTRGFEAVFLASRSGAFLGSVRGSQLFLPK